jgi:hypothetical protein
VATNRGCGVRSTPHERKKINDGGEVWRGIKDTVLYCIELRNTSVADVGVGKMLVWYQRYVVPKFGIKKDGGWSGLSNRSF